MPGYNVFVLLAQEAEEALRREAALDQARTLERVAAELKKQPTRAEARAIAEVVCIALYFS